ncbi:uncharacterized protein LOC142231120 [Haematobia irritans]|uniref:uncharacterized protein LOC142231120 n=1 Tax=Haematobia irritans TaxID=7368 RepID=UPI003F4F9456
MKMLREAKEEDEKRLQRIEDQLGKNKIIIKGIESQKALVGPVINLFREKLKLKIDQEIEMVKKIHEEGGKMTLLVELKTYGTVLDVLKKTKLLAGSNIFIERDLRGARLQRKKVMLQIKKELHKLDREKKSQRTGRNINCWRKDFLLER